MKTKTREAIRLLFDGLCVATLIVVVTAALFSLNGCAKKTEQVDDPAYEDAKVCFFYADGLGVNIQSDMVAYWAIADNVCYRETSPSGTEIIDCGRKNLTTNVDPGEGNCLWIMDGAENEVTGNFWTACTVKDDPLTVKRLPVRWDVTLPSEPESFCVNHVPQCSYSPVADWGGPLTDGVLTWTGATSETCCDSFPGAEIQPFCACVDAGGVVECDDYACACGETVIDPAIDPTVIVDDPAEPGFMRCNTDANDDGIFDDQCRIPDIGLILVCTEDLNNDGVNDHCVVDVLP